MEIIHEAGGNSPIVLLSLGFLLMEKTDKGGLLQEEFSCHLLILCSIMFEQLVLYIVSMCYRNCAISLECEPTFRALSRSIWWGIW